MAVQGATEDPIGGSSRLSVLSGAETFQSGVPESPYAWTLAIERARVAIAEGANVSGRLVFGEAVRIEGNFRGEVRSNDLVVIGDASVVEGKVLAPRLVVMGALTGDVVGAERVMLGPRARVTGDIEARQLVISEGAQFEGRVHRPDGQSTK